MEGTSRAINIKDRKFGDFLAEKFHDLTFKSAAEYPDKRDNANINTDTAMGTMLKYGTLSSVYYLKNYVLPKKFVEADDDCWVHLHDLDFSGLTFNCCQIDLLKLFHGGFSTGHGFLREPNSIRSYASLACIAIQSDQNDMFGGQSINAWDYAMAEGVRKTFAAEFKSAIHVMATFVLSDEGFTPILKFVDDRSIKELPTYKSQQSLINFKECLMDYLGHEGFEDLDQSEILISHILKSAFTEAEHRTIKETHNAMEAAIHNFNTLHSRAGKMCAGSYRNIA